MMNAIVIFFRFLFAHKWKIVFALSLFIWFLVFLFPFNDLNDLISTQISKQTNNNIFLQFDNVNFNPLTATVSFEKVFIESPQISTLTTEELSVSPSFSALISQKPGGTIKGRGFLKGDFEIHLTPTSSGSSSSSSAKNNKGEAKSTPDKYKIEASAQNISLKELKEVASLSLPIKGQLSFNTQTTADITFIEQPEGEVSLTIQKFELPPSTLNLQDMGNMNLPEIKLEQIELKGKLSNGKFLIETGKIGTSKDEFYGDIKGEFGITFQNLGGQVVPILGAYSISLDMKANAAFKERAKFFLTFLDGYKKEGLDSTQYKFKVQASAAGVPPQFTPLQ